MSGHVVLWAMNDFRQRLAEHEEKWVALYEGFEQTDFFVALLKYMLDTPFEQNYLFNTKSLSIQMDPPPVSLSSIMAFEDSETHFEMDLNIHVTDETGGSYQVLDLMVPYALIEDFSREGFDLWLADMLESRKDMAKIGLLSIMADMFKDGVLQPSDVEEIKEKFQYVAEHNGEFPEDLGWDDEEDSGSEESS